MKYIDIDGVHREGSNYSHIIAGIEAKRNTQCAMRLKGEIYEG